MPIPAPDFERLFVHGARHRVRGLGDVTIRLRPVGELSLPSGRIVAGEPFFFLAGGYEDGFVQQVPPGRYPVVLVLAEFGASGDDPHAMVVAARLVIRDEPVVSWELALRPGQDVGELEDDEFFGYPVDGGTSGFADAQTVAALGEDYDDYSDRLMEALDDREDYTGAGFVIEGSEPVLVVFSSGDGDGYYPTWVGRTAAGEVACVLNDFFIVPGDDEDDEEPAGPAFTATPPPAQSTSTVSATNRVSAGQPLTPVSAPLAQQGTMATRAVPARPVMSAKPMSAATPARPTVPARPARPASPPPDTDAG